MATGDAAVGLTFTLASNSNSLLNDTSQTPSDVLSDYPPQYIPPEGIKTLSATTLWERKRTPCIQTPQEGEKTPCSHTPQEGVKTPCVQSHIVFIQDQVQKRTNLTVGSRLKSFLPAWKTLGAHRSILNLIVEGYKLPFRERPKLSRIPCITSGFANFNKVPCRLLFKTYFTKAQSTSFKNQRVWVSTVACSWFQNQATAGGQ